MINRKMINKIIDVILVVIMFALVVLGLVYIGGK